MNKIPKGTLLAISEGEYSNYHVLAFVRTLREIDVKKIESDFRLAQGSPEQYEGNLGEFVPWAISGGLFEIVDNTYQELHIGDYGTIDFDYTTRPSILVNP